MSQPANKSFVLLIVEVKFLVSSFSSINRTYMTMDSFIFTQLAWYTKWIIADDGANNKDIPQVKMFKWVNLKFSCQWLYEAMISNVLAGQLI